MAVLAAALIRSLLQGPAAADVAVHQDPKDAPGRLDIRRIAHGHSGDEAVTHTITTYRRFSSRLLRPDRRIGGVFYVALYGEFEEGWPLWGRIVQIRWRHGRLRAPIYDLYTERRIGTAKVTRPNRRSVRVAVRLRHQGDLGEPRQYYWDTASIFRNRGKCIDWCEDWAPNRVLIRHRLPDPPPEEPAPEEGD